ncbi:MAG: hypothetical protein WD402_10520 [Chloroflexota bacterium]
MSSDSTHDAAAAYERVAGTGAIAAGIGGIVYSVAFLGGVVAGWAPKLGLTVASIALMAGGFLSVLVLVALYRRLLDSAAAVGLLGLMLVAVGATGAMVHGGYDLANAVHPPVADVLAEAELPSGIDPRGLLTFGISGLGLLVLAWQSRRSRTLPSTLTALGMTVGALLIVVYLGRLIILTPTNLLVAIPAAATGLVLSPLFYIWLGIELRRR